jgi:hypothetical protein
VRTRRHGFITGFPNAQDEVMATIRILPTVCVALFAFVTLILGTAEIIPAAAQTAEAPAAVQARPGRPLNLLPQLGRKSVRPTHSATHVTKTKSATHLAKTKTPHRVAQRRAPTRAFARRRNVPEMASRENTASVTPTPESLGYQADGAQAKTQPPIDAWLRSPLPPTRPRAAARLPATTAAVSPLASPAPAAVSNEAAPAAAIPAPAIPADTIAAHTVAPDTAPADLSASDNVQVADAGQINEIDLAADATPTATTPTATPANRSWLNGLLALLAGAFAAAATASFLFGRRRAPKFHRSYS